MAWTAFLRSGKPILKFRGGQLAHENNEYFTPRKLPAIYMVECHLYHRTLTIIGHCPNAVQTLAK